MCYVLEGLQQEFLGKAPLQMVVLPCFARLDRLQERKVFEDVPKGKRKVVVATNVAETSITIPGITYIVDSGVVKVAEYDWKTQTRKLGLQYVSKSSAKQRKGRAGRTGPGMAYRIYTKKAYKTFKDRCRPEVLRCDLSATLLLLNSAGCPDLLQDLLDSPSPGAIFVARCFLREMEAFDEGDNLTNRGRLMSRFPLPPRLTNALLKSGELGCSEELLTIAAMLEEESLFPMPETPPPRDIMAPPFNSPIDLLKLHWSWRRVSRLPTKTCRDWALERGVCLVGMKRVDQSRCQLRRVCTEVGIPLASCRGDLRLVRQALCFGFIRNAARKDASSASKYRLMATDYATVGICRRSACPWIVFTDAVHLGNRLHLDQCTPIEPDWMVRLAPHLVVKGPLGENDVNFQVDYQSENRAPVNKKDVPKEGVPVNKKDVPKEGVPVNKKDVPKEGIPVNKNDIPKVPVNKKARQQEGCPKGRAPVNKKDVPKEAPVNKKDVPKEGVPVNKNDILREGKGIAKKHVPKEAPVTKRDFPKKVVPVNKDVPKEAPVNKDVPKEAPDNKKDVQKKGVTKKHVPKKGAPFNKKDVP
ncbi:MAG: LOW QUALITY PROTEIN: hypothetical protein KVP17_003573 [Porospora cf. gigantea B]|uniref:uncharacterized protein n=1 Tax=Porospora cf. gigantea B TaxID=2853592 RepID=UPI003571A593|nr:MAG: LOW QUALITY PROTEIN: hypothetical protein KVP17_003573 [Porospora cf. gigantea B]